MRRNPFSSPFARSVTVTAGGETRTLRAFIQPLSLETPEVPRATAAGVTDPRRWLMILDAETLPNGPVTIADGETVYALLRRESVAGHVEGILCRSGKDVAGKDA